MPSSGTLRRVALARTDVSVKLNTTIIRVTKHPRRRDYSPCYSLYFISLRILNLSCCFPLKYSFSLELSVEFWVPMLRPFVTGVLQVSGVLPAGQASVGAAGARDEDGGMIAAITISCIGAACLLLLVVLWVSGPTEEHRPWCIHSLT
jgi:hypothetical protein